MRTRAEDEAVVEAVARELSRAYDASVATHEGGWREVARVAISLGARPRSGDRRARLAELLGVDSTNFLGTGLSMRELMELHSAEKLARSWSLQPREEQRRRLEAVMRLSVELERIRQTESFATRLAEMAIEAVIEGDWKMVEEWADHFAFEDERDEIRIHGSSIYGTFRELLLQGLRAEKGASA